jgi:oligopeptide/dipeptide ABC transporter ATP-binding protein
MSALLRVEELSVRFPTLRGDVAALEDLAFEVREGETVALVGESGSGKSTAALALSRLIPESTGRIISGRVIFEGRDLLTLGPHELREVRGRRIGMIFQDPMMALNPVFTIGWQLAEPLRQHFGLSHRAAREKAVELLGQVAIAAPEQRIDQYPHNLSGGMRQRVMIAMALACRPSLLIADEPTTALDVTVQAQVLSLIKTLKDELGTAVLLITHDLGVVWEIAQRVIVMYAGRKVEDGKAKAVFDNPQHPYARELLRAAAFASGKDGQLPEIPGSVPSPFEMPPGCRFAPRCRSAREICRAALPRLKSSAPGHEAACVLVGDAAP